MGDATFRHIYAGNDTTSDAANLGANALLAADVTDSCMFAALRAAAAPAAGGEPEQQQQEAEEAPRQGPGPACTSWPFLQYQLGHVSIITIHQPSSLQRFLLW